MAGRLIVLRYTLVDNYKKNLSGDRKVKLNELLLPFHISASNGKLKESEDIFYTNCKQTGLTRRDKKGGIESSPVE